MNGGYILNIYLYAKYNLYGKFWQIPVLTDSNITDWISKNELEYLKYI